MNLPTCSDHLQLFPPPEARLVVTQERAFSVMEPKLWNSLSREDCLFMSFTHGWGLFLVCFIWCMPNNTYWPSYLVLVLFVYLFLINYFIFLNVVFLFDALETLIGRKEGIKYFKLKIAWCLDDTGCIKGFGLFLLRGFLMYTEHFFKKMFKCYQMKTKYASKQMYCWK